MSNEHNNFNINLNLKNYIYIRHKEDFSNYAKD